jgi:hypothetical protein
VERTLSQLLPRANKVVAADQGLYLRGWFREDGLRGQNLNMVLTILTIKTITVKRTKFGNCPNLWQSIARAMVQKSKYLHIFFLTKKVRKMGAHH